MCFSFRNWCIMFNLHIGGKRKKSFGWRKSELYATTLMFPPHSFNGTSEPSVCVCITWRVRLYLDVGSVVSRIRAVRVVFQKN